MIAKVITVVALSIIVVNNFNSEGGGTAAFALSTKLVNKSTRYSPAASTAKRISLKNYLSSTNTERSTNVDSFSDTAVDFAKATTTTTTNIPPPKISTDINDEEANSSSGIELYSVDVRYDLRSPFIYDTTKGRYVSQAVSSDERIRLTKTNETALFQRWKQFLVSSFVPEGVSESYFDYVRWRVLQRFVNANVHVIGTQSLLMGLRGMHASGGGGATAALGAAAATSWVLKDTLGKVVRMAWASRMGRKFDPDAKRWRFRASLIYALGNGLEVCTYLRPRYFLVLAMLANSCKQMSMLTSSATRNAIYNSFRRVDNEGVVSTPPPPPPPSGGIAALPSGANGRGAVVSGRRGSGGVENIGDITAKGEAQIAVVDLLGIASGICLTRAVGVSVQNVLSVWIMLQIAEIFCMYHEMRSVVYKTFNFERMYTVLGDLMLEEDGVNENEGTIQQQQQQQQHLLVDQPQTPYKFKGRIPTPRQIATKEKIFLPPDHLARRAIAFGSPGRTMLDPDELDMLIKDVFRGEKYFLVVGQDVKNERGLSSKVRQWMRRRNGLKDRSENKHSSHVDIDPQEQCHIVLHADANNLDILKSALALVILRKKLVKKIKGPSSLNTRNIDNGVPSEILRSRDCMIELRSASMKANEIFPGFLRELTKQGWRPPLRSMLGRVSARADWEIQRR